MARKLIQLLLALALLAFAASCKRQIESEEPLENWADTYELPTEEYAAVDSSKVDSLLSVAASTSTPASIVTDYPYTWSDSQDLPPMIIIIDDFGYARGDLLQAYAELPSEVVFAVLPDLPQTRRSGEIAIEHGHEVIIHIPMEARGNRTSPGERYIKTGLTPEEITEMVSDFYLQLPMAIAGNNHMGTTAVADAALMDPLLDHLNALGLFFIDSAVSTNKLAYNLAKQKGFRTLRRDIFLDVPDNSDATIASKIESLPRYRGRQEPIVVITHCHNREKLVALQKFIAQVQSMGVKLISLNQAQRIAGL